ncbi:MAG: type II toxin-antitoxin system RelE/ParE family toxin [Betaproteobacteria bacterium]|nr:type II toxin-antitoxin system RelE/ParE family toxin [Betaproteobacteria bacterium]
MAQVIFSQEALADLERLGEFLLEQAPGSAADILTRVTGAIEILADHPLIGRRVEGELRELVISRGNSGYLALYCFDVVGEIVRLLRIRHQREAGYRD